MRKAVPGGLMPRRKRRCGLENIFKLLRPGGNFIALNIVDGCMYVFCLSKACCEYSQYKEYMKDFSKYLTPIHYEENPRKSIKKFFQGVGCETVHFSMMGTIVGFKNEEQLTTLLLSINPFIDRMPEGIRDEYRHALLRESLKQGRFYKKLGEHVSQDQNMTDL